MICLAAVAWVGEGEWGITVKGYRVSLSGVENIISLDYGNDCATLIMLNNTIILQMSEYNGVWNGFQKSF